MTKEQLIRQLIYTKEYHRLGGMHRVPSKAESEEKEINHADTNKRRRKIYSRIQRNKEEEK